jgi:hypothetical protein
MITLKLHPQLETYQDAVKFFLVDDHGGKRAVALPVTMEAGKEGALIEPAFALSTGETQELFEKLWAQGFRSKHDKGNAEALDAARLEHIADLRKAAKLA